MTGYSYAALITMRQALSIAGDVLADDVLANKFFSAVIEGASRGVLTFAGADAQIPWKSWLELDVALLKEIESDFFEESTQRIAGLMDTGGAIPALKEAMEAVSMLRTVYSTFSRLPALARKKQRSR